MIDTILFDLDGTIYNETDVKAKAELYTAEYIHRNTEIEAWKIYEVFRKRKKKITGELAGIPQANDRKTWFDGVLMELGQMALNSAELAEYYWKVVFESMIVYEDFKFILPELQKKYKLYILTDEMLDIAKCKLRKLNISNFFSGVISAEEVGYTKPAKELYDYAAKSVGKVPNQIVVIGDNPLADIKGGNLAGMHTVWLQRGKYHCFQPKEDEMPEITITNYVQLMRKLGSC